MQRIYNFFTKYAIIINSVFLCLSFVLLFLPINVIPKQYVDIGMSSYNAIMHLIQGGLKYPNLNTEGIYFLVVFLLTWLLQIASIALSKKMPILSIFSTIPFTALVIYTIYFLFGEFNTTPHIGFYVMILIYCFYIFETIIYLVPLIQKHHKLTDKERIAELERQVAELKEKDAE